jgi:diguanylate cyclase (GGDEF)-like protein/PAS domain S-box-containing protein
MFGYSGPEEIVNRISMSAVISDQDMEMVHERVRQREAAQIEDMRYRFLAKRKDGSHFHVEVHGKSSTYNNEAAVIGVVIDVTDNVVAEQRIRDRDDKIRALFSENVIGILSWDAEGIIRDANPVFREMLGLTKEDLAGAGLSWKSITPPEYHEVCNEYFVQIMTCGRGSPIQKEYLSRATGERIPVLVNGVRYGGGDCVGISFVLDLRNTRRIQDERDMLASMVEWAPAAMFVQDLKGRFVYLNKAAQAKGEPFGGLMGKTEFDYMEPETAARVVGDRERIVRTGQLEQFEEEIRYQSVPEPLYFRTTKWPLGDARGKTVGLVGVVVDVSAQKTAQVELARSKNLVNAVFENMPGLAILRDLNGHIVSCNNAFIQISGLGLKEIEGQPAHEVLPAQAWKNLSRYDEEVLSSGAPHLYECEIELGAKSAPYLITLFPIFDELGKATVLCSLLQSQEKIRQAQLEREARLVAEYEAEHDPLTGLPNRKLLFDRMEQHRQQAQCDGEPFSVYFLDLNRFKSVNDTYGHEAGDELLRIVAERMLGCLRSSDTLARLGGDEFVVLLRGDPQSDELVSVIHRLHAAVGQPIGLKWGTVAVSCCIGHAVYPKDGITDLELLAHADRQMYEQKAIDRL